MTDIVDYVVLLVQSPLEKGDAKVVKVERNAHAAVGLQAAPGFAAGLRSVYACQHEHRVLPGAGHHRAHHCAERGAGDRIDQAGSFAPLHGCFQRSGRNVAHLLAGAAPPGLQIAERQRSHGPRHEHPRRPARIGQPQEQAVVLLAQRGPRRAGFARQGSVGIIRPALVNDARHEGKGKRRMDAIPAAVAETQQPPPHATQRKARSAHGERNYNKIGHASPLFLFFCWKKPADALCRRVCCVLFCQL